MVIPIRIKITETVPAGLSKRGWKKLSKEAHFEAGEHWRTKIAPKNFKSNARSIYKYRGRSAGYRRRSGNSKRPTVVQRAVSSGIKRGGTLVRALPEALNTDLIFTGLLRKTILDFSRTRGFPTRATISTPKLPAYAPARPRSGQPPIFDETTRLNKKDAREVLAVLNKAIDRGINKIAERKTTHIRS